MLHFTRATLYSGISVQIHSNDHLYAECDTRLFGFHQDSHLLAEKQN